MGPWVEVLMLLSVLVTESLQRPSNLDGSQLQDLDNTTDKWHEYWIIPIPNQPMFHTDPMISPCDYYQQTVFCITCTKSLVSCNQKSCNLQSFFRTNYYSIERILHGVTVSCLYFTYLPHHAKLQVLPINLIWLSLKWSPPLFFPLLNLPLQTLGI